MSGQRFTIHKESEYKDEWYAYPFCIKCDGELVLGSIPLHIAEAVRDKLNEQQEIIQSLQKDIIEMCDSHQSYIEMKSETHSKMNDIIRTQRGKIFRLDRENKQLRQILKDIVGATDETYTKNKNIYKVTVVFDNKRYREIRRYIE